MSIALKDLYENIKDYEVTLIAGENGLKNKLKWMHIVENKEIAEFLEGNEIVFTTGIGVQSDDYFYKFIKKNKEKNISGIIINTGPYIKYIPESVIDYCNANDLPLFTVPWHIKMPQIMKVLSKMVIESEESHNETKEALLNAIFNSSKKERYVNTLENIGLKQDYSYVVTVIDINKESHSDNIKEKVLILKDNLEKDLLSKKINFILLESNNSIITLFYNHKKDDIEDFIKHSLSIIKKRFHPIKIYYGIGNSVKGLEQLGKSYKYAKNMLDISIMLRSEEFNIRYSDLPIYKLFLSIDDKSTVEEYYNSILGNLIEYDRINKTDYTFVLKHYFYNNCHVINTANKLFVHRNTINYKINKIEEILDCDLSDIGSRSKIYMAIMIEHIIL